MPAPLERLVRQHAETSRLMGVDFVPAYRSARLRNVDCGSRIEERVEAPDPALIVVAPAAPTSPVPSTAPASAPRQSSSLSNPQSAIRDPQSGSAQPRDPVTSQRLLDELRARYERDAPHKQFVTAFTKIVFGEGDPCARLMFVGEAPGAEEDRTGRPFVGRAGQLLDKMIAAMGLKREQVYIANVLKTRPPDNATPTSEEIRICAPYLYEQIAIINPVAIVALGLPATRALLDTVDSMSRLRGRWHSFKPSGPFGPEIPVMPTYHPAFLLRSYTAENRGKVWSDLRQAMTKLGLAPAESASNQA